MGPKERIQKIRGEQQQKDIEAATEKAIEQKNSQAKTEKEWQHAKAIFTESSAEQLLLELQDQYDGELRVDKDQKLISLCWGNNYYGTFICIKADISSDILTISGKESFTFGKNQFKNTEAIETAMAKAYLNPDRYDNSWSIN